MERKKGRIWGQIACLLVVFFGASAVAFAQRDTYTISGYVLDAESREALIGATVYAPETQQGAYTNAYGFFSLSVQDDVRQVRVSYVGYDPQLIDVAPGMERLTVQLSATQLAEVVVTGDSRQMRQPTVGALDIPVHIIKSAPALLGESDLMKAIQLTPGVQSGTDGGSGIHIRGGGGDENMIVLDGVPVYNIDHLLGFFSVFNPSIVKKVALYKGSFPARYGGRLSGVVDVRTNDGNMKKYTGSLGIGILSAKAQIEGPIIKDRTSFNFSARRSWIDLIARPLMNKQDGMGGYYFYDLNLKLHHRLSKKDQLYLSVYNGSDKLYITQERSYNQGDNQTNSHIRWGNLVTAMRWNSLLGDKLHSDLSVSYTRYGFDLSLSERTIKNDGQVNGHMINYLSGIEDLGAHWNMHYTLSPRQELRFGADYVYHRFRPEAYGAKLEGEARARELEVEPLQRASRHVLAHDGAVYIESRTHWGALLLNLGVRATAFRVDDRNYFSIQPRADLDLRLTDKLSAQVAYSRMGQHVHLLTSSHISLPTDLWVPTTGRIKPMASDQFSVGGKYEFLPGCVLGVDAYYKLLHNVLEYKDGASFVGNSQGWEDKVATGRGRAYGIEFLLMKTTGRTTGWLGYTLARSERQFPDGALNGGAWFPYKYDRRHQVNAVVSLRLSQNTEVAASWEMHTGGALTIGTESQTMLQPDYLGKHRPIVGQYISGRNNFRLPTTHRLNVSFNFTTRYKNGAQGVLNVSIYNVYNAKNPSFILPFSLSDGMGEGGARRLTKFTLLPMIPSVSYTYKF